MELVTGNSSACYRELVLLPISLLEDGSEVLCPSVNEQQQNKSKRLVTRPNASVKEILQNSKNVTFAEDDKSIKIVNLYPNILRRSDLQKGKKALLSPVKSLAFSPSRFLNIGKFEESHIVSENCKVLSFSGEDSGISDMDFTLSSPFSLTPRSKSRRKLLSNSVEKSPDKAIAIRFNSDVMQSTPKSVKNNENKTPLIQKYLNESVMRTPSPFKCPESRETKPEIFSSNEKKLDHGLLMRGDNECFKKPSVTSKRKSPTTSQKRKTARKALLLDHPLKSHLRNQHTRAGFLKLSQLQSKKSSTGMYDHSSLTEKTAVVEKRKVTPVKSVYFTRRRKADEPVNLSTQWVSVACGKTSDQKDMIAAAKRCLDLCQS